MAAVKACMHLNSRVTLPDGVTNYIPFGMMYCRDCKELIHMETFLNNWQEAMQEQYTRIEAMLKDMI